jgi:HK97 family phage major capsid protein
MNTQKLLKKALQRSADIDRQLASLTRGTSIGQEQLREVDNLIGEQRAVNAHITELRQQETAELREIAGERGVSLGENVDHVELSDWRSYIRSGEQRAGLSTTDGNGGYLVPEPLHAPVVEKVRKVDPIFAGATHFDMTGGGDTLQLPYKSAHGVVANATESGARSEQSAPTFGNASLVAYDYYTDQRSTQLFLDSTPGASDMLSRWIIEDLYEQLGVDLAVGSGANKASGLFAATSYYQTKLSGVADSLANTSFMPVMTALHPRYRTNAVWLMNSATLGVISGMTVPNTQQPLVDWTGGEPRMYGKPIRETSSAPDIGAGQYPIALADLAAAYCIGMHRAPGILTDPLTCAPLVRHYGLMRAGGVPWDPQGCILLKSAA